MHLNPNRLTVAVDIDLVLTSDYLKQQRLLLNELLDVDVTQEEMMECYPLLAPWGKLEQVTPVAEKFYHDIASIIAPREDAVNVLGELAGRFNWVNITGRPRWERALTRRWVRDSFPGVFRHNHIFFSSPPKGSNIEIPKAQICHEQGIDILIDDLAKEVLLCPQHGITGIIFGSYPWSEPEAELPPNVYRAADWYEVQKLLYELNRPMLEKKTGRNFGANILNIDLPADCCPVCGQPSNNKCGWPAYGELCGECLRRTDGKIFNTSQVKFHDRHWQRRGFNVDEYDWKGVEFVINHRHCVLWDYQGDFSFIRFSDDNSDATIAIGYWNLLGLYREVTT